MTSIAAHNQGGQWRCFGLALELFSSQSVVKFKKVIVVFSPPKVTKLFALFSPVAPNPGAVIPLVRLVWDGLNDRSLKSLDLMRLGFYRHVTSCFGSWWRGYQVVANTSSDRGTNMELRRKKKCLLEIQAAVNISQVFQKIAREHGGVQNLLRKNEAEWI